MTAQEISFFRSELSPFYDAVLAQFSRDYEGTKEQMAPSRAKNTRGKIAGALRGIGNAIAQILFISSVSDNVSGDEFDYDPNRFKSRNRPLAVRMQILNFKKKCLKKLAKYYRKLQEQLNDDRKIPGPADALWKTGDLCDQKGYPDLAFATLYVYKCGLCSWNRYCKIAVLEDLQKIPQEMRVSAEGIKRYNLEFEARSYAHTVFENYRNMFGKEYTVTQTGKE